MDGHGGAFVVTGASQGIGLEVATQLARMRRTVAMVGDESPRLARSVEQVQESAAGGRVLSFPADLSRMRDVARVAAELGRRLPRIASVIHCAGVIMPARSTTVEGLERTFATNALAPFLLTWLLFDRLRSSASRVLFLHGGGRSSFEIDDLMSERRYDGWTAYAQSKNAGVMIALELAHRWRQSGVAVNAVFSGIANTGLLRRLPSYLRPLVKMLGPLLRTPAEAAVATVWAATAPDLAGVSGKLFGGVLRDPRREARAPGIATDARLRRRLVDRLTAICDAAIHHRVPSPGAVRPSA